MILDAENIYENESAFNMCGLMDATEHTIARWKLGPHGEGENRPRRPNWFVKQRSVHSGHKKHHGLSVLTISYPNGMSTTVGVVSARH